MPGRVSGWETSGIRTAPDQGCGRSSPRPDDACARSGSSLRTMRELLSATAHRMVEDADDHVESASAVVGRRSRPTCSPGAGPYSETFATSGMTRNGQLFPLPVGAPIGGNEYLSRLNGGTALEPDGEAAQGMETATRTIYRRYASDGTLNDNNLECADLRAFPRRSHGADVADTSGDGWDEGRPESTRIVGDLMLPSAVMNLE